MRVLHRRRHFFGGLSAFSMLLCASMIGLWIYSRHRSDLWIREEMAGSPAVLRRDWIGANGGRLVWEMERRQCSNPQASLPALWVRRRMLGDEHWDYGIETVAWSGPRSRFPLDERTDHVLGCTIQRYGARATLNSGRVICVPCSWFVVLFALLPMTWLYRAIRYRPARRDGICRSCGYDLRATPDRCPECGTAAHA